MFVGSVSSELGGHCVDNVLFWNTYRGDAQTRDCSSLHTNAGVTYRGECRAYEGGAACWRVNGTVDHAYIMESREKYQAIVNPPTTTTTLQPNIINLECPACPETTCPEEKLNSDYIVALRYLNSTLEECKKSKKELEIAYVSRIPRAVFDQATMEYDIKVSGFKNETAEAKKELEYEKGWTSFYKYGIIFMGILMGGLIVIWVKKPQLEDNY